MRPVVADDERGRSEIFDCVAKRCVRVDSHQKLVNGGDTQVAVTNVAAMLVFKADTKPCKPAVPIRSADAAQWHVQEDGLAGLKLGGDGRTAASIGKAICRRRCE
jgi:hypothetical protein